MICDLPNVHDNHYIEVRELVIGMPDHWTSRWIECEGRTAPAPPINPVQLVVSDTQQMLMDMTAIGGVAVAMFKHDPEHWGRVFPAVLTYSIIEFMRNHPYEPRTETDTR